MSSGQTSDADVFSSATNRRVVLLEGYNAHGECLDFQLRALRRAGLMVEVWTGYRNPWRPKDESVRHLRLRPPVCFHAARMLWQYPPALLVVNTATGPVIRNILALTLPLRIPTVGIFHDVAKVKSHSSTRMIARTVQARISLAEHLARAAEQAIGLPFAHVHLLNEQAVATPSAGDVSVVIPGEFSLDKKDAQTLLTLAAHPNLDQRVRFVLLGRFSAKPEAAAWWQRCVELVGERRISRFLSFVPQNEFNREVGRCSAILPLIQPRCDHYPRFRSEKISGAVNLALGAQVPLLTHADLAQRWRFGPVVTTYEDDNDLLSAINQLADRERLATQRASIASSVDANTAYHQSRYLRACAHAIHTATRRPMSRPARLERFPGHFPTWMPRPLAASLAMVAGGFFSTCAK